MTPKKKKKKKNSQKNRHIESTQEMIQLLETLQTLLISAIFWLNGLICVLYQVVMHLLLSPEGPVVQYKYIYTAKNAIDSMIGVKYTLTFYKSV